MKLINITVPTRGNITPYEIHRAIANREEYLEKRKYHVPEIRKKVSDVKLKKGAGLWNFITGCLP